MKASPSSFFGTLDFPCCAVRFDFKAIQQYTRLSKSILLGWLICLRVCSFRCAKKPEKRLLADFAYQVCTFREPGLQDRG